jgi:dihydrofolate synthase/folylpolyglutamate synthase
MMDLYDHPFMKLPKFGQGVCLYRVNSILSLLDRHPSDFGPRSLVIVGSNGKGSTSKISSELLRIDGKSVGLFTSPHLYRYNERFQIDGEPIETGKLFLLMDRVYAAISKYSSLHDDAVGAFEAQFILAVEYFCSEDVHWMVFEAGIGGRYDPVRLVGASIVGLVSLDLEHTEVLGNTLQEIAFDKMDAVARGGTVVLGESCLPFEEQLRHYGSLCNMNLSFVGADRWVDRGFIDGLQEFDITLPDMTIDRLQSRLVGRHQINNHAVAMRICGILLKAHGAWNPAEIPDLWRETVRNVTWPGRLERVHSNPPVYIDVGHTPAGIQTALDGFRAMTKGRNSILVTGVSKNKDIQGMLSILAPAFDVIICTAAYHKGADPEALAALVRELNPSAEIFVARTIEEAAELALDEAARRDRPIYVAGGLFLSAEFAECCRGRDPRAVRFF